MKQIQSHLHNPQGITTNANWLRLHSFSRIKLYHFRGIRDQNLSHTHTWDKKIYIKIIPWVVVCLRDKSNTTYIDHLAQVKRSVTRRLKKSNFLGSTRRTEGNWCDFQTWYFKNNSSCDSDLKLVIARTRNPSCGTLRNQNVILIYNLLDSAKKLNHAC